jgi:hypothetical protein
VTDPADADRPTMAPFLGALAIIVLVVITIGLFNIFGKNDVPEDQQVGRAAVGQNDALHGRTTPTSAPTPAAISRVLRPMSLPGNGIRWPNAANDSSTTSLTW